MYAYKIFDKFKIYRPYSLYRKDKWRTNCSTIDVQGFEQLPENGDLLIITKSLKDVMVLYKLGYNAVALQSENDKLNYKIYQNLSERFKRIVILFDNDEPGILNAEIFSERYGIPYTFIPISEKIKDISDYIHYHGIDSAKNLMKNLL